MLYIHEKDIAMNTSRCHCIVLRRASKAVTEYYDRMLRPCGVTISQFALLRTLQRLGSSSVSDLALNMRLERSTLVRTLRPLLDSGLIADHAAPGTRNRDLSLTDSGTHVLKQGGRLWDRAQRHVETSLGAEKMELLDSVVRELQQL